MKIKHWQGYGTVNVIKKSKRKIDFGYTELVIEVSGNHEWGIYTTDIYRVYDWLLKRFDKSVENDGQIVSVDVNFDTKKGLETGIETCIYKIVYEV